MLQIDHIYEFFYQELFKDFDFYHCLNGIVKPEKITSKDIIIFTIGQATTKKIFLYDQEPILSKITEKYIELFKYPNGYSIDEIYHLSLEKNLPDARTDDISLENHLLNLADPVRVYKKFHVFVVSEKSKIASEYIEKYGMKSLYYFFHGFAALDWYRGHYALNHNKSIVKQYKYDFITFNRIITNDRSYRIYFVSLLKELELLDHGQVSFNVTDNLFDDWRDEVSDPNTKLSEHAKHHAEQYLVNINKLVIDKEQLPGSVSADIPRSNDAFWHIVTETVFYYDKLHLTEKIFKPIVSKQPFMLLAAPGNLAYLKSYGFKTFDSVIDESYDTIQDPDLRTEAVIDQLHWYCNLTPGEKTDIIQQLEPVIQHNFDHFYGEFRHIITKELLDNTKTLFKEIGYDDRHINYTNIHHVLTR